MVTIMTVQEIAVPEVVSFDDLRSLASAKGPCITVVAPLPNPLEIRTRLKNAIREVEKKLAARGTDRDASAMLVEPLHRLAAEIEVEGKWANALILFCAPAVLRYFWLHESRKEAVTVADRFQIRPLLSVLSREQRYYILALSMQHTRLFHGNPHNLQEKNLLGIVPQNLRAWMQAGQPDHVLDNRAISGPSTGSMKGVMFGTNTDREREDEYLSHFFKDIDKGLHSLLRDRAAPLLLAGVEYEVALYRKVNTYPHLWERAIYGSPDHLPERELHRHAMEIVMQSFSEALKKALADFEKRRDRGRASLSVTDVVKAAFEGRVDDMLLSEDAELWGICNSESHEIQPQPVDARGEDLLNAAALETILHHGRSFALRPEEMPEKAGALAVLRF